MLVQGQYVIEEIVSQEVFDKIIQVYDGYLNAYQQAELNDEPETENNEHQIIIEQLRSSLLLFVSS